MEAELHGTAAAAAPAAAAASPARNQHHPLSAGKAAPRKEKKSLGASILSSVLSLSSAPYRWASARWCGMLAGRRVAAFHDAH